MPELIQVQTEICEKLAAIEDLFVNYLEEEDTPEDLNLEYTDLESYIEMASKLAQNIKQRLEKKGEEK